MQFGEEHIRDDATVGGDGFGAYRALAEKRATLTMKFDPQNNPDHMKWLHKATSNAKSFLLGTYHGIKGKRLRAYTAAELTG
ncbi:MAG: transposase [Sulfobacillus sp.]